MFYVIYNELDAEHVLSFELSCLHCLVYVELPISLFFEPKHEAVVVNSARIRIIEETFEDH